MRFFYLLLLSFLNLSTSFNKPIVTRPSIKLSNDFLPLFWKLGNSTNFKNNIANKITFNDFPICIYRDNNENVIAISDICVHRGASLSSGKINNNCIQCPYHGWEYNNGIVDNVPGCPEMNKKTFGVPRFEVNEINDDIYIRPSFDINSKKGNIYNQTIYISPEALDSKYVRISGMKKIKMPNQLITENILDMLHISYVHSFGNSLSPIPFEIEYEELDELSGKTIFHYTAGQTSMSKILGGVNFVKVENEFYLPDTTVTRVYTREDIVKTIVTHCYPISETESILHYDLYRNFLVNPIFDILFQYQMEVTLKEDINTIKTVHKDYNKGFMSTKFDITQTKYREKKKRLLNS